MKQEIHITLRFELATGKVNLNEIVYKLKQLRDPLMAKILEKILSGYDDLICERLNGTYSTTERKGIGRHAKKKNPERGFCRGRKVGERYYQNYTRQFSMVFGEVSIPLSVDKCCQCQCITCHSPLVSVLKIGRYAYEESNFQHEVIEAVINTNYWRLIGGRSIDISFGGIHTIMVGSEVDQVYHAISIEDLSDIMSKNSL